MTIASGGSCYELHVHSLRACVLRPAACLLALGAAAPDDDGATPLLSAGLRARWLGDEG